jgi:hypothetical protein
LRGRRVASYVLRPKLKHARVGGEKWPNFRV